MAILSPKDMKTHNSMLEWVYLMGGHSVLPKAAPMQGRPYSGATSVLACLNH
jgi:hypothetical protein